MDSLFRRSLLLRSSGPLELNRRNKTERIHIVVQFTDPSRALSVLSTIETLTNQGLFSKALDICRAESHVLEKQDRARYSVVLAELLYKTGEVHQAAEVAKDALKQSELSNRDTSR